MNLQPLSDHVVVKPQEEEEAKVGNIIIPDTAKEQPQIGSVVAVGPGKRNDEGVRTPLSVKAGDKVVFSKFGGTEFDMGGEEYKVMRESDILAVID